MTMRSTIASIVFFSANVLAFPHAKDVAVVQVRQIERRQDTSSIDIATLIPSDIATLIPSSIDLGTLIPSSIDISTLIPSGCLPDVPPAPTPPAEVGSALNSAVSAWTDYCEPMPSITGSVGEEYASYTSAVNSWAKENGPALEKFASEYSTACPLASGVTYSIPADLSPTNTALLGSLSCGPRSTNNPSGAGTGGPAGSNDPTSSGGPSPTTGSSNTASGANNSQSTGAAPERTAMAAAAGLFAGVAGLVAAL